MIKNTTKFVDEDTASGDEAGATTLHDGGNEVDPAPEVGKKRSRVSKKKAGKGKHGEVDDGAAALLFLASYSEEKPVKVVKPSPEKKKRERSRKSQNAAPDTPPSPGAVKSERPSLKGQATVVHATKEAADTTCSDYKWHTNNCWNNSDQQW